MAYSDLDGDKKQKEVVMMTAKMLKTKEFSEISIKSLADDLGWAKGTIYNFFSSQEEIFIALYLIELDKWLAEIREVFSLKDKPEEILDLFVKKHCRKKLFLKLMPLLSSVLEEQLLYEAGKDFKFTLLKKLIPLSEKMAKFPWLKPKEVGPFIINYTAHIIGLSQMSHISNDLNKVFKNYPELSVFYPQFETELKNYVHRYFSVK